MKKILIIAAHPDDESLGCGGTIKKHTNNGDKVRVLYMTDGESSRNNKKTNAINKREKSAIKSQKILGIEKINFLNLPDNEMDKTSLLKITKMIEKYLIIFKPSIIYTHHYGDLNIDHRITFQAVMTACRPQPNYFVEKIFSFEIPSSTDYQSSFVEPFQPSYYVDIEKTISVKVESLKSYISEMRESPHSRSIENIMNLARYRGGTVGKKYCEAFSVIRYLK